LKNQNVGIQFSLNREHFKAKVAPSLWCGLLSLKEKATRNVTIPAKHGEPDAKKPDPGSRSTLAVVRKKKVRKRGMLTEKRQAKSLQRPFILIRVNY